MPRTPQENRARLVSAYATLKNFSGLSDTKIAKTLGVSRDAMKRAIAGGDVKPATWKLIDKGYANLSKRQLVNALQFYDAARNLKGKRFETLVAKSTNDATYKTGRHKGKTRGYVYTQTKARKGKSAYYDQGEDRSDIIEDEGWNSGLYW